MLKKLFFCMIIVLDLIQQLHLITTLTDCLKTGNFQIQKWARTLHMCLQMQAKIFFADAIRKLMDISNICVENVMDHFEK